MLVMLLDAFDRPRSAVAAGAVFLGAACAVATWGALGAGQALIADVLVLGGGVSAVIAVTFLLSAAAVLGGYSSFATTPAGPGSVALVLMSAAGAALLATSLDLVIALIALETMAVCAYALVVTARTNAAYESSMKYFVQGAVATGLFVMGLAIAAAIHGSGTGYRAIGLGLGSDAFSATLAAVLVMSMFAFKLGAAPFHSWAPDVFETAPSASAGFLASAPKIAALMGTFLALGVVFTETAFEGSASPSAVFAFLAAASIVIGNLGALRQTSFGRMLGYSGIAQVGYALVGVTLGVAALPATMVFATAYGLAVLAAFLVAAFARSADSEWDGSIAGLGPLLVRSPWVAISLAVALFSLTGIPLTAGFIGKLMLFSMAIGSGYTWLAVVGLVGSVVSFGYYGNVLRAVFFEAEEPAAEPASESAPQDRAALLVAVVLAALVLAGGVAPLMGGTSMLLRFFAVS
jgi:NADH-quinone oxidoreductase subunit N